MQKQKNIKLPKIQSWIKIGMTVNLNWTQKLLNVAYAFSLILYFSLTVSTIFILDVLWVGVGEMIRVQIVDVNFLSRFTLLYAKNVNHKLYVSYSIY